MLHLPDTLGNSKTCVVVDSNSENVYGNICTLFYNYKEDTLKKNIVQVTHYLGEGDGRVKLGRGNSKLGVLLYQYASSFQYIWSNKTEKVK